MWVKKNGELVQVTDESREKFRTNVSHSFLEEIRKLADEYDTHANYIIESGLRRMIEKEEIPKKKEERPQDRIQYKTTYDKELLDSVRNYAAKYKVNVNDVIESCRPYIDVHNIKGKDHRYRIE